MSPSWTLVSYVVGLLVFCAPQISQAQTLVELAESVNKLSTLSTLLAELGLNTTLSEGGPYTVFAPSNAAFEKRFSSLDSNAERFLTSGEEYQNTLLTNWIAFHVVEGNYTAMDLVEAMNSGLTSIDTLGPWPITPIIDEDMKVNGQASVVTPNAIASNGIAHIINKVLTPEDLTYTKSIVQVAKSAKEFSKLIGLVKAANLDAVLGGEHMENMDDTTFTVFAPTNDAIKMLKPIPMYLEENPDLLGVFLGYHVVAEPLTSDELTGINVTTLIDENLYVDLPYVGDGGAVVVENYTDLMAFNGVIHAIDQALIPPGFPTETMLGLAQAENLTTLIQLAQAASTDKTDIVSVLDSPGAYTLFAPTDEAFAKLNLTSSQLELLTSGRSAPTKVLQQILLAHVLSEQVAAEDLGDTIDSLAGEYDRSLVSLVSNMTAQTLNGVVYLVDEVIITESAMQDLTDLFSQ